MSRAQHGDGRGVMCPPRPNEVVLIEVEARRALVFGGAHPRSSAVAPSWASTPRISGRATASVVAVSCADGDSSSPLQGALNCAAGHVHLDDEHLVPLPGALAGRHR